MIAKVILLGALAGAGAPEATEVEEPGRNTARLMVGGAAAVVASFPNSIGDPGPGILLAKPFWLGPRKRAFQWVFDASFFGLWGTETGNAHLALSPRLGFDILIGPVYGMEIRFGPGAVLQAGPRTVAGFDIFAGSFAHSFRLKKGDDDHRLKVLAFMNAGFWAARDPENDLATNNMAMGIGLGYETPY